MNPRRKKRHEEGLLTVGEIAREVGILASHVRYYTRIGLLTENSRTQGRYRLYKKADTIKHLEAILRLKKEGLNLGQIQKKMNIKEKSKKIELDTSQFPEAAIEVLRNHPVKFAYLFGSFAKGSTTSLSDIDIAVYLDEKLGEHERFDLRLKLIGYMMDVFRTDKIDLIILNDVPVSLSYQAITYGKIIYCKDELARIRYEAKIMSLYFDQQYYHNRHVNLAITHIAKEGIL